MYRGDSTKDLDVIVYRHKTSHPIAWGHLVTVLKQELGMKWFQPIDHAVYGDDKTVIVAYIERQRVDFICLF
jgi:hypothetical protein